MGVSMASGSKAVFSRPVSVLTIPPSGLNVQIESTPEERLAIASEFNLPVLGALRAEYRLTGTPKRVKVKGRVFAEVTQICVVSLDFFESTLDEVVEVEFATVDAMPKTNNGDEVYLDAPEEIVNGQIDLGILTAEFLSLGLDPYPRKPGADFSAASME